MADNHVSNDPWSPKGPSAFRALVTSYGPSRIISFRTQQAPINKTEASVLFMGARCGRKVAPGIIRLKRKLIIRDLIYWDGRYGFWSVEHFPGGAKPRIGQCLHDSMEVIRAQTGGG